MIAATGGAHSPTTIATDAISGSVLRIFPTFLWESALLPVRERAPSNANERTDARRVLERVVGLSVPLGTGTPERVARPGHAHAHAAGRASGPRGSGSARFRAGRQRDRIGFPASCDPPLEATQQEATDVRAAVPSP